MPEDLEPIDLVPVKGLDNLPYSDDSEDIDSHQPIMSREDNIVTDELRQQIREASRATYQVIGQVDRRGNGQKMTVDGVKRYINKYKQGFEVITGPCVPYIDVEIDYADEETQKDKFWSDLKEIYERVRNYFWAGANILTFESSGKKHKGEAIVWRNSFRFIVRGAGYYAQGSDLPIIDGVDPSVYKKAGRRQLLRMPYCSYPGENRFFKRVLIDDNYSIETASILETLDECLDACDQETFEMYLAQHIEGEPLMPPANVPRAPIEVERKQREEEAIGNADELRSRVAELLGGYTTARAEDRADWVNVCHAVGHVAREGGIDLLAELQEWASKASNYSETETEALYNDANGELGMGSLVHYWKQDNPGRTLRRIGAQQAEVKEDADVKVPERGWVYSDYLDLIEESKTSAGLTLARVKSYIKGVYVFITNSGNGVWYTREIIEGLVEWTRLSQGPCENNDFTFRPPGANADYEFRHVFINMKKTNQIKTYKTVDYRPYLRPPTQETKEIFNLFRPFPWPYIENYGDEQKQQDEERITPILKHIDEIICAGDEAIQKYYKGYLAHIVQKPDEKPEVMLAQVAKMGLGKDLINFDLMEGVIGAWNCYRVCSLKMLKTRFNKEHEGKLLTIISELRDRGDKPMSADDMKSEITDKKMNIEPKGKEKYTVRDYRRFIGFGNNRNCLSIAPDDRRFVVWDNKEKPRSRAYYNDLAKLVFDPLAQQAFFNYLSHYDISDYNPRILPTTEYKQELQEASLHNGLRFVIDFVQKMIMDKQEDAQYFADEFFGTYSEWANRNRETRPSNMKNFYMTIKAVGIEKKRTQKNGIDRLGVTLQRDELIKTIKEELGVDCHRGI